MRSYENEPNAAAVGFFLDGKRVPPGHRYDEIKHPYCVRAAREGLDAKYIAVADGAPIPETAHLFAACDLAAAMHDAWAEWHGDTPSGDLHSEVADLIRGWVSSLRYQDAMSVIYPVEKLRRTPANA
jgi:hypothetical protein